MALFQLLLEQLVAGPGAGQEQPEALEAEKRGSEDSFGHGAPKEKGSRGVWTRTQAGMPLPSMPLPPGREEKIVSGMHARQSSQAEGRAVLRNARKRHVASSRQLPRLHLLMHRNEAQELVHVAHRQPVGVEFHRGLHLLGLEEVLQGLVHLLALSAAHTG